MYSVNLRRKKNIYGWQGKRKFQISNSDLIHCCSNYKICPNKWQNSWKFNLDRWISYILFKTLCAQNVEKSLSQNLRWMRVERIDIKPTGIHMNALPQCHVVKLPHVSFCNKSPCFIWSIGKGLFWKQPLTGEKVSIYNRSLIFFKHPSISICFKSFWGKLTNPPQTTTKLTMSPQTFNCDNVLLPNYQNIVNDPPSDETTLSQKNILKLLNKT